MLMFNDGSQVTVNSQPERGQFIFDQYIDGAWREVTVDYDFIRALLAQQPAVEPVEIKEIKENPITWIEDWIRGR